MQRRLVFTALPIASVATWSRALAQSSTPPALAPNKVSVKPAVVLLQPNTEPADRLDQALALLRPPTSTAALEPGIDLLLQVPDIVGPGAHAVLLLSAIAQTDGIWLFGSSKASADTHVLLGAFAFDVNTLPEVTLPVVFSGPSQMLRMVARANGRYFSVTKRIHVGKS